MQVIAGAGANSTMKAIEYQKQMEDAGADATLQVVPYYNKPSQEGLFRHFHAVADVAQVPVVLYDVPGRTATGFSVETVVRLSEHPLIAAIKAASGSLEFVTEIGQRCSLPILSGDDGLALPIIGLGGVGVISVVSNVVPELMQSMCTDANRGEQALARSQHDRMFELAKALVSLDSNPVPVKAALEMLGWDTGVVRPPLMALPANECQALRIILESLELLKPGLAPEPMRAEMNIHE
jgi:4-hydroxy-tetrahydrodipicolinate synthase